MPCTGNPDSLGLDKRIHVSSEISDGIRFSVERVGWINLNRRISCANNQVKSTKSDLVLANKDRDNTQRAQIRLNKNAYLSRLILGDIGPLPTLLIATLPILQCPRCSSSRRMRAPNTSEVGGAHPLALFCLQCTFCCDSREP